MKITVESISYNVNEYYAAIAYVLKHNPACKDKKFNEMQQVLDDLIIKMVKNSYQIISTYGFTVIYDRFHDETCTHTVHFLVNPSFDLDYEIVHVSKTTGKPLPTHY